MKRGMDTGSFYGSSRNPVPSLRDLKRVRRLEQAAAAVSDRKAADALSCPSISAAVVASSNHSQSQNHENHSPNSEDHSSLSITKASTKSQLLSSHTKYYQVFGKQSDALINAAAKGGGDLKVFAFEVDFSGKRQFVCCHPLTLWSFYQHLKKRHYYEVIPGDAPCKLYFDLEFKTELNPDVNGPLLTQTFKERLCQDLCQTFGCRGSNGEMNSISANNSDGVEIIDLDSSTSSKFSRHLIVKSHVFENVSQMRAYVLHFCGKLRQDQSFPKIRCNDQNDSNLFVDEGVYTKNRNFRLFMSSKFGKEATLELASTVNQSLEKDQIGPKSSEAAATNSEVPLELPSSPNLQSSEIDPHSAAGNPEAMESASMHHQLWEKAHNSPKSTIAAHESNKPNLGASRKNVFFDSLITNVDTIHLLQFYSPFDENFEGTSDRNVKPVHMYDRRCSSAETSSSSSSPFPEADAFVVTLVNDLESGRTGYIRKVSQSGAGFLTYEIAGSFKYCYNVERHHKSNNIKYVVDLEKGQYFQTCHDPNCRDFRSNTMSLPETAQPWLSMFTQDFEKEEWDSKEDSGGAPSGKFLQKSTVK